METTHNPSTHITWHPEARLAEVRYTEGAKLTRDDGVFLVETLTRCVGAGVFAVLADAQGLAGTDAHYRATAGQYFKANNKRAFIALVNMGPVIRIVVDLFAVATGVPLKAFAQPEQARAWLRSVGIPL